MLYRMTYMPVKFSVLLTLEGLKLAARVGMPLKRHRGVTLFAQRSQPQIPHKRSKSVNSGRFMKLFKFQVGAAL